MLLKGNYTDGKLIGWKPGLAAGATRIVRIRQLPEAPNEIYADQLDFDGTGALTAHVLLGKEGIDTAIGAGTFVLVPDFKDTTAIFSANATMPAGLAAKFNAGGTYRAKPGAGATVYTPEARQNTVFLQQQAQTVLSAQAVAAVAAAKGDQRFSIQPVGQPSVVKRLWDRFDHFLYRLTGIQ